MGSIQHNAKIGKESKGNVIDVHTGLLEKLDLGTFSNENQIPEYQFDLLPDLPDAMGIHRLPIETTEGIHLVYYFQNYGMEAIQVFPRKMAGSR